MKDERRNVNRRQNVADINLVVGFSQSTNGPGTCEGPLQLVNPRTTASSARCQC
jgi:hypothetical protein